MAVVNIKDPEARTLEKITLETSRTLLFADLDKGKAQEALGEGKLHTEVCSSVKEVADKFRPSQQFVLKDEDGQDVPARIDYFEAGGEMARAFDPDSVITNIKRTDDEHALSPLMKQRVRSLTYDDTRQMLMKSRKFIEQADAVRDNLARPYPKRP
jgi:hypothetical protein